MKKNSKIILRVLTVLVVITSIAIFINFQSVKDKAEVFKAAEISVLVDGVEISRFNVQDIGKLSEQNFTAMLKSSIMNSPEEHSYTGITLAELFKSAGISLKGKNRVVVHSIDGYIVPLKIEEIEELDNVYLVYKDNGDYLKSIEEKDGQGPFMIVVRGDQFSQRWAKFASEIEIQ
ncbi:MAG: hypothetical protein WCI30_07270 [Clostridia bacterium]